MWMEMSDWDGTKNIRIDNVISGSDYGLSGGTYKSLVGYQEGLNFYDGYNGNIDMAFPRNYNADNDNKYHYYSKMQFSWRRQDCLWQWYTYYTPKVDADFKNDATYKNRVQTENFEWRLYQSDGASLSQSNISIGSKMSIPTLQLQSGFDVNDKYIGEAASSSVYSQFANTYLSSADFNNDRITDLIKIKCNSSNNYSIIFGINTGSDFKIYTQSYLTGNINMATISISDYDNDGSSDVLFWDETNKKLVVIYFDKESNYKFVKQIFDGFGESLTVSFKSSTHNEDSIYVGATNVRTDGKILSFEKPIFLLAALTKTNGSSPATTVNYHYERARYHIDKRALLRFDVIIETSSIGTTKITEYENLTNSLLLNARNITINRSSDGKLISFAQYTKTAEKTALGTGKGYFNFLENATSLDDINKTKTVTTPTFNLTAANKYEVLSNITQIYDTKSGSDVLQHTSTTAYTYSSYGSFSRPKTIAQTEQRAGEAAYSFTTDHNYDTKGQLIQSKKFSGDANYEMTNNIGYDRAGNVIANSLTAYRLAPSQPGNQGKETRSTSYTYDGDLKFFKSMTDPLGYTTLSQIDAKFGYPTKTTAPNGLSISFQYDANTKIPSITTYADGITKTSTISWALGEVTNSMYKILEQITGSGTTTTWYDALGKVLKIETPHVNGTIVQTFLYADAQGRMTSKSYPYFSSISPTKSVTYAYYPITSDLLQRIQTVLDNGVATTYSYNTNRSSSLEYRTTRVMDSKSRLSSINVDATGKTLVNTDKNGQTVTHTYYSHGGIKASASSTAANQSISFGYDPVTARQTSMNDPSLGIINYDYNDFGELCYQKEPNNLTWITYNIAGQVTSKSTSEGKYTYEYNNSLNAGSLGQIKRLTAPNGNYTEYAYDNLGRVTSKGEKIDTKIFTFGYTYDANSRLQTTIYPNGFNTNIHYDASKGYLASVKYNNDANFIWRVGTENELGMPTNYTLGETASGKTSINIDKSYDALFKPFVSHAYLGLSTSPDSKFKYEYGFNASTGNLTYRKDYIHNLIERFEYDANYDRLTAMNQNGFVGNTETAISSFSVSYLDNGNINSKTNLGTYQYNTTKPNTLMAVNGLATGTINQPLYFTNEDQNVSYNCFNKVSSIWDNLYRYDFTYGADNERRTMKYYTKVSGNFVLQKTHYYVGEYEEVVSAGAIPIIEQRVYISSPYGQVAMHLKNSTGSNTGLYYTHSDHLGSVLALTNENGVVVEEHSYEAWGQHRNPTTWAIAPPSAGCIYTRGFTNHEHLYGVNLINMNGRIYDPAIGMFLSPDPILQDPGNTQNYNRYSYVLNNPLKYTDPTGLSFWDDLGSGFQLLLGIALQFVPGGQGIGGQFILAGSQHFFQTASGVFNNGMSWMEASNQAGFSINIGGSFTPQWGMGRQQIVNPDLYRSPAEYQQPNQKINNGVYAYLPPANDGTSTDGVKDYGQSQGGGIDLGDAINHWRTGNGTPYSVDASTVDLSSINLKEFNYSNKYKGYIATPNLFFRNSSNGSIYGNLTLKWHSGNKVGIYNDVFDFEMHDPLFSPSNAARNANTLMARPYVGIGKQFEFQFYGEGTINVYSPTPAGFLNFPGINMK